MRINLRSSSPVSLLPRPYHQFVLVASFLLPILFFRGIKPVFMVKRSNSYCFGLVLFMFPLLLIRLVSGDFYFRFPFGTFVGLCYVV